jgi:hypothetical protein
MAMLVGPGGVSSVFFVMLTSLPVTAVTFETGSDQLKAINDKVYIGTGHFVLEQGKPPVVEYKVSEVVAA